MSAVAYATTGRVTLARYLARRFLLALAGVYGICVSLIFIVDTVENLRRASGYDVGLKVILLLTLYRLPSLAELVLPFAVLFAAMISFLMLTRSLELVVARAAGVSVWQFIAPALITTLVVGIAATTLYNPLATALKERHELLVLDAFGGQTQPLGGSSSGLWLRQDGVDGPSVLHAKAAANDGQSLNGVTAILYNEDLVFRQRIEAESAQLEQGRWRLENAWVISSNQRPEHHPSYLLGTYLTPAQVRESFASADTISFWQLPEYIDIAERAGLPATQYRLQYQILLARPLVLCTMVLIAATVSLRVFRFGNIGRMILIGIVAGFVLYVVSKLAIDLGKAGAVSPFTAAWAPAMVTSLLGMTVLLFQEDG